MGNDEMDSDPIDPDRGPISQYKPSEQNPAAVYLSRLAPTGRRPMRQALDSIAGLLNGCPNWGQAHGDCPRCHALAFDWSQLRHPQTQAIREALAARYKPSSVRGKLCALRGVLRAAHDLGHMSTEEYAQARRVGDLRVSRKPAGRHVPPDEVDAVLKVCRADKSPTGARDAALVALLYVAGPRRSELLALTTADYEPTTCTLTIRTGAPHRGRIVPLGSSAARYLSDWLAVRGNESGPLFCPIHSSGRVLLRRMSGRTLWEALAKRSQLAGVPPMRAQDLRRTWIEDLLTAGLDATTVAEMAGHASILGIARYEALPQASERGDASSPEPPYHGAEALR